MPVNSQNEFYKFHIVPCKGRIFYAESSNNRFYYLQLFELAKLYDLSMSCLSVNS